MTPPSPHPLFPSDSEVGLGPGIGPQRPDYCSGCPYAARRVGFVPGEGPATARLIVIGEAPGRKEVDAGRPFIGPSGLIQRRGLGPSTYITNLRKCLPPEHETEGERVRSIAHCAAHYLQAELSLLTEARAVHLVGGEAAFAIAGVPSVLEAHGAVYSRVEADAMRAVAEAGESAAQPDPTADPETA